MPGIDRRPSGSGSGGGGGGAPSGPAGGALTGTYPNPTLNQAEAAQELGLGKYVAVGYGDLPTWVDPVATDWADVVANDYGWAQIGYVQGEPSQGVAFRFGKGDTGVQATIVANGYGNEVYISNGDGSIDLFSAASGATSATVIASAAQTAPVLDLQDNDANVIFRASPLAGVLGLGKLVESGYNSLPTWIDPAADDWADVEANDFGWVQFRYGTGGIATDVYLGSGDGSGGVLEFYILNGTANFLFYNSSGTGSMQATVDGAATAWRVTGEIGQTSPLLDLQSSASASIFAVAPDGSVGGGSTTTAAAIVFNGTKYVSDTTTYLQRLAGGAAVENIGAVESNVNTVAATGSTETLDTSVYGVHDCTMDQSCTFTFSNPAPSGKNTTFVLILRGAFTPTLPGSVKWSSGSVPTYTTPSVYVFTTVDAGTTYYATQTGKAFA